ncbi:MULTISPECIES: flagellin [unclassified Mesorhizobium]|uniref:flagellin N-terminal helical domain-containing protein n=1 Tax=unclassified Mesorhizobium TaxID=325217 RepID=UPI000FCC5258|nr:MULTISPECIES: flagellin [unclassified Mesorhizobium]RUW95092.1 flagellin [Mesorhizobium sp. M8A.F.Ca.ET.023.01.1.1]RUW98379.1 flagellin [Mesorhizobium sp. M8A.F.Ca.ET.059.01.1.1]TGR48775.1 flagellin [bacterium M00.F.Ca.ET.199.01.1.1]TGU37816.1 flagellin [bacterium M00.F.Ca.ET.156.01.1.1]TGU96798.1 flagellin [Mesorhizobium sp. M00.F.Ca.ET.151.01.1.1]TGV14517.1 flagellin [Mesorhizobium sp. M8A.F.Ca.ET.173.01.1.1]TGV57919.1 flagellin [bacterium M00.F.Ca.ET.141.01.1.1]TGV88767.1 flagellin [M
MASIMTNAAALTALQSLNATNKSLEQTQARISTGYRVSEASDNAAYWSIATTMRSDNQALSTVQDALGLGASKVDIAYTGMNNALDTIGKIKTKLLSTIGQTAAAKAKTQTEITTLQAQMKSFADAATFSGSNYLSVTSNAANGGVQSDAKIVSSFNRSSSGAISLGTIDINLESTKLFDSGLPAVVKNQGTLDRQTSVYSTAAAQALYDAAYATALAGGGTDAAANTAGQTAAAASTATKIDNVSAFNLDITAAGVTDDIITQMIGKIDNVMAQLTDQATILGSAKSSIDLQKTFTQSLMDSIDRGVGQLVDADMNKESTRLQALQVQQQLGIQSLSIANSSSQSILSLFKNG